MIIGLVLVLAALSLDMTTSPPGATAAPARGDAPEPESGAAAPVSVFRGYAFDTCVAPTADTMRRWKSSKYRAIGVYYAGRGRACKNQPNLSRSWMNTVRADGWRILPVYVGSQSPCVGAKNKKGVPIGRYPTSQGKKEGRDAVTRAKAYGMRAGSPLYLDMEAYAYKKAACARTTLAFIQSWNRTVRASGYVPGFYSSADSGVRHMDVARRAGEKDLPSVMWFARWRTAPRLYGEPALGDSAWRPARRIHQYAGNVKERHGGRTLVIDRNLMHAPVARF
ncbi:DUF1906 domain-containing protein [Streptomyces alfalfae]|uniref:DUF1906 domain-containing protein n=2 Tax=Streptomyces TaxID=1883 RepID=A0A1P8TIG9_9ACTN|nr:hypothetical protein A7J05_18410 [Streptomyces alfalfae]AYA17853.1 DUF1906 domain-containing protein [Streptomyces fradiae]KUL63291.1 hypothetical protein ADL30_04220 [Streptomyces sp. NRRL S-1521]QQC93851.1 DUF1906 domain-containing protein [Streptomyces alfalfae]QUI35940.1 DUF1906 domain-containing protein [Streptomyces alfalfae]